MHGWEGHPSWWDMVESLGFGGGGREPLSAGQGQLGWTGLSVIYLQPLATRCLTEAHTVTVMPLSSGMKVLRLHIPLGHRYRAIAHQISADCCLEFTASSSCRMFHGLSGQLVPLLGVG